MAKRMRYIICILTLLLALSDASGNVVKRNLLSDYVSMPSHELLLKGFEYLSTEEQADSSLICFSIVAERYSPQMPAKEIRECAMALNNCGFIYYYFFFDFPSAFDALLQAEQLCSSISDDTLMANINLNLGNCYSMCFHLDMSSDNSNKSLIYYYKGYQLALKQSAWPILLNCFSNLAYAPYDNNCPQYVANAIRDFNDVPLPSDIPDLDYYKMLYGAAVSELDNDPEKALKYIKDELSQYSQMSVDHTNRLEIKADILYQLSYSYQNAGLMDSALTTAKHLIDYSRQINRPFSEAMGYRRLQSIYSQTGESANLAKARLRFLEIKDSIMADNNLMMVDNITFIARLRQENRDYIFKEQQYHKRMMILSGFLILLIITLPLLWMLYRQNRKLRASYLALFERQRESIRIEDAMREARDTAASSAVKPETDAEPAAETKSKGISLDDDEINDIKLRILKVFDHNEAIFNPNFSLDKLSELTGIRPRVLSTIINEVFNKNFYSLLNEYRIREACRRLADRETFGNLTIEAISLSVGYKSRTSLINAFKKETGLTPSEYQKISIKQTTI